MSSSIPRITSFLKYHHPASASKLPDLCLPVEKGRTKNDKEGNCITLGVFVKICEG